MHFYSLPLFAVSCAALVTNPNALKARQAAAVEDTFNIYVYGKGISGLSLFYADGKYSGLVPAVAVLLTSPSQSTNRRRSPIHRKDSPTSVL